MGIKAIFDKFQARFLNSYCVLIGKRFRV